MDHFRKSHERESVHYDHESQALPDRSEQVGARCQSPFVVYQTAHLHGYFPLELLPTARSLALYAAFRLTHQNYSLKF